MIFCDHLVNTFKDSLIDATQEGQYCVFAVVLEDIFNLRLQVGYMVCRMSPCGGAA